MNTHGHESVAKEAGLPLLKEAFSKTMGNPRLNAFYLGNWIADLSQLIDPVSGDTAREKIENYINEIFDFMLNGVFYLDGKNLLPLDQYIEYDSIVRQHKQKLLNKVDSFFNYIIKPDENGISPWYKAVQPGILLKGYFKFVHPETTNQELRMDLEAYLTIFEKLYQQYYPHEHLDRPPHPNPIPLTSPTEASQYDDRPASGPRSGQQSQFPDLYLYLRDFLQIIAGTLAKLDLDWASSYLNVSGISDKDLNWNLSLATLGNALHGLEDFFAHSNFVEHAALVMGDKYIPKSYQFDHVRFLKRLKRYDFQNINDDDWRQNAFEDHVVTGYFDFKDTKISISHLLEEGLPLRPRDVTRDIRKLLNTIDDIEDTDAAILDKFDEIVSDFLEVIDDPKKLNVKNRKNTVVTAILWFIDNTPLSYLNSVDKFIAAVQNPEVNLEDFTKLFERIPLFQEILQISHIHTEHAAKLFKAFFDFVRLMTITFKFLGMSYSIYKSAMEIVEISAAPEVWLLEKLPKNAAKMLASYPLHYAIESKYRAMGAERIGCHSLLSKDHGRELLYPEMMNCAAAAHYYVVKTLLRWADPDYVNQPEDQKWVNWLELIEHLTNHPAANLNYTISKDVPVEIAHTITPQERQRGWGQLLKDLQNYYQPFALRLSGLPFSSECILHGNCSIKLNRYNWVPLTEETVALFFLPSLAMPLRLRRLIIPHLKFSVNVCNPETISPRWYMSVMQHPSGWQVIKSQGLLHTLKYHLNRQETTIQADDGEKLRKKWKDFYRPKKSS